MKQLTDELINKIERTPVRNLFELGTVIGIIIHRDVSEVDITTFIDGIKMGVNLSDRCNNRTFAKVDTDFPNPE